jgi:cobyric acid synthase CobQ/L-threonine-O-3-phosphate decarboxylase
MPEFRHGGHIRVLAARAGRAPSELLDFSANINPLGPPDWLRVVATRELGGTVHYPDPDCLALKQALSARYGVPEEEIAVGNGSTELIHLIPRAFDLRRAVTPVPSYADYEVASKQAGLSLRRIELKEERGFEPDFGALGSLLERGDLVFVGHPNNPTGRGLDRDGFLDLVRSQPSCLFVVDEAFLDLSHGLESFIGDRPENLMVLVSLTKSYAVPGLRLGCLVAGTEQARRIEAIRPPWSVNALAQAVGRAAVEDRDYIRRSRELVRDAGRELERELAAVGGLTVFPGAANYRLVRIDDARGPDARALANRLIEDGLAVRVCENFRGLDRRFFRTAVRMPEENAILIRALRKAMGAPSVPKPRRRTPAIMFQGTSSNAGKSILAAALCRILLQDGYSVAPFKAQNMSLNSFVTRDGGEMGRAQVVQARACRLEPDVRMNPVLLKPSGDTECQVILMGKPVDAPPGGYFSGMKTTVLQSVRDAYDSLAGEHDAIVIEGAGSPAEINLRKQDIVNMETARYAGARVLIVGDIDRGGVFASFIGTMECLSEWERALVAGFIVNRFRGREELIGDAYEQTEFRTGKPVLGTVPYMPDHGLPEEDSVTFKSGVFDDHRPKEADSVEIALVDLPHISNFTDFDALRSERDVRVRVIRGSDPGRPDALIIPGSKNVASDLKHLYDKGLAERIRELAAEGRTEVVGVCGGFQMLGRAVEDPWGIESQSGAIEGLGLLEITTVLERDKTLVRTGAIHIESGKEVRGYEIHHGVSRTHGVEPVLKLPDGRFAGAGTPNGRVWGAYLHGIFDDDDFRRWFIDRLRVRKGLKPLDRPTAVYDLEPRLDRLALTVRAAVDIGRIYRLMGL